MKISLTVALVLTLTACAPSTTWKSFTRSNTPDAQRDQDWQECHHRYINKASYLNMAWLVGETVGHEPKIRACMFEKGYDTRQAMR
jgi:hypothetical protein